jgi:hypothetical protein
MPIDAAAIHCVGVERRPVLVIDDFVPEPERLVAYAESGEPFHSDPRDYYPGIRKPAPSQYAAGLCTTYAKILCEVFSLGSIEPHALLSALSITTTSPDRLRPVQRVPHFDTSDPRQLAVVHYLCEARHGGTSFYRHRKTGYETISQDRLRGYAELLKQQVMAEYAPPPRYMDGDNPLFERIASVEARFNRAVIYPGNLLHSGNILQLQTEDHSPRTARLTANSFLKFSA